MILSNGVMNEALPIGQFVPPGVVGLPLVVQSVVATPQGPTLSTPSIVIQN